jgi:hypothetical protein
MVSWFPAWKQFGLDAPVNSTGVLFELAERDLRRLANLDKGNGIENPPRA